MNLWKSLSRCASVAAPVCREEAGKKKLIDCKRTSEGMLSVLRSP